MTNKHGARSAWCGYVEQRGKNTTITFGKLCLAYGAYSTWQPELLPEYFQT